MPKTHGKPSDTSSTNSNQTNAPTISTMPDLLPSNLKRSRSSLAP
jgi:hypothetical protein